MTLLTEPYLSQQPHWPETGRHILAQFDNDTIIVYQAYHPSIGTYAAAHGRFGPGFSPTRMTWIKPNFLWMMYRCGWATKPNQETVLAIRIARENFDKILAAAVPTAYTPHLYPTAGAWREDLAKSSVRVQWDPDHHPKGDPFKRRALQLGLAGNILLSFLNEWLISIEDVTPFVHAQRAQLDAIPLLRTPRERVYTPTDPALAARLHLDAFTSSSF